MSQAYQASQIEETNTKSSSSEQSSSLIPCVYCNYQGKSENEVLNHSVNAHPQIPARPDPNLLKLIQNKNRTKGEEVKI